MIEGPVGVFRAAVPRGDENRKPIRPKRLSHSLPPLRDVRRLLGVCPAGAELTFPALAFVVEMQPTMLIQFEHRRRRADGLRQQFGACRRQSTRNDAEIYR